jgi:hypothetical protein
MPSPKDIEYIQELEYMKQIEFLQHQITSMENEMGILRLAQENIKEESTPSPPPTTTLSPSAHQEAEINQDAPQLYHDYPSPVSISSVHDFISKKQRYRRQMECGAPSDLHLPTRNMDLSGTEGLAMLNNPKYQRICNQVDSDAVDIKDLKREYMEVFLAPAKQLQQRTIAQIEDVEAILSKAKNQPWTLTVKNGNMQIDTHIKSHAELMAHLKGMLSTSMYQKKTNNIPFPLAPDIPVKPAQTGSAIGMILSLLIWKKYGKSRFKSMTKYTPTLLHFDKATQLIAPKADNIANIAMRLIYTFTQCLHLKLLYIHVPTLIKMFMKDEDHVMKSPVIMALCADICHLTCKHITEVVPNDSLTDYGLFYFEQARELIADQFDQANLETLLTFTFMAIYHIKTQNDVEGDRYLCMAERVYSILLPQYQFKQGKPNSEEAILFSRMYRAIYHARNVLQLHDVMMNMFKYGPKRIIKLLDNQDDLDIYIAQDDTPKEIRFIKMRRYLRQLRESIKEGARCAAASDFPTYVGVFGHHIEMAMRHWYRNVLPQDFQLSLPLFEDDTPDIEFFTKLELECGDAPEAILTTLMLYNEYLIMSKSYLPKDPNDARLNTEDLLKRYHDMQNNIPMTREEYEKINDKTNHWIKLIERMMHVRKHHLSYFTPEELEESEEEYFTKFIHALNPSKLNFDMPFIHTSVRTALNMVRIIQFLLSRESSCFLDLRWVMNCWEVLLRAARFKYQQPGDEEVTLDRIRANLILCLNIISEQIKFSRHDSSGSFVKNMQQDFDQLF